MREQPLLVLWLGKKVLAMKRHPEGTGLLERAEALRPAEEEK